MRDEGPACAPGPAHLGVVCAVAPATAASYMESQPVTSVEVRAPIPGRIDEVRVSVGDQAVAAPDGRVLMRIVAPGEVYADAGTQTWGTGRSLADRRAPRAIVRGDRLGDDAASVRERALENPKIPARRAVYCR